MKTDIALDGNGIRVLRVFHGYSQRELAEASGLKPWRIWRLEQGVSEPRPDEVVRIVGALTTYG